MAEDPRRTDDVFRISRDLPLNYVSRASVDEKFVENLTRDKHVVVFGSSKQGKTTLRKHCLNPDDYVTVTCSNRLSIGDLHSGILKSVGYEVVRSATQTYAGDARINAKLSAKVFGSGLEVGGEAGQADSVQETTSPLELDPTDVNDIIHALDDAAFDGYIVLEDFHYLPVDTQKNFAVSLKAFHENSTYCFIIIGVWLEEHRLTVYNGDLTGRVVAVNADEWSDAELSQVISDGARLLNIRFAKDFIDDLVAGCQGSVSIAQEACNRVCKAAEIYQEQETQQEVGGSVNVGDLVKEVVDEQTGRYNSFLVQFAEGFQSTELEMYRWLLHPVLKADPKQLEDGLRLAHIRRDLEGAHPRGSELNPGNVTQALRSAAALQVKKDIKPIILDYDETNLRLNVVDRGFLVWLRYQDSGELLRQLGLPSEEPA